ncbi:plasmid mobilization protein [Argonema antarcticum]|uniref:plasmid mobilization protein n=1 Tax=Argonema antarcticum TaxID=2942763 RepID=UPI00201379D5|nr:hypothetical protein [Argonema antarcticum]MCL1472067.1 hypothetical protein [Argonema antarcticum A004/B2]
MLTTTTNPTKTLPPKSGRTENVRVRLTTLEKEDLTKRAAEAGEKTVSDYLRKRAFNCVYTVPAINEQACAELRKMGTHLYQMTRFVEKAVQAGQIPIQSLEVLQEFSKTLGEYHQELRGKIVSEFLTEPNT